MTACGAVLGHVLGALLCCAATARAGGIELQELRVDAPDVSEPALRVRVYLPPDYAATEARYQVLYVNDGQDMEAVGMASTLEGLFARHAIERVIVVAIDMPPDRMRGYGLFDRTSGAALPADTRFGAVGGNAHHYATWLVDRLVPSIDARYRTLATAEGRTLLGWSLGAVGAFGIGWQYPEMFGRVGAFSPSFWLSTSRADGSAVQATRIAHRLVDASARGRRPSVYIAVGSGEETNDRDGDGVIDVIDDTHELVNGWASADGRRMRGIREQSEDPRSRNVELVVLQDGTHTQATWARMLPLFLAWAYGRGAAPEPS